MSQLKFTPEQLRELADVLTQLSEITADTGIHFDAYGACDIEYAGNVIKVRSDKDGKYYVDNYCS